MLDRDDEKIDARNTPITERRGNLRKWGNASFVTHLQFLRERMRSCQGPLRMRPSSDWRVAARVWMA